MKRPLGICLYLLRFALAVVLASWWIVRELGRSFSLSDPDRLIFFLSKLEVLHSTFYAMLPAAALFLFLPGRGSGEILWRKQALPLWVLVCLFVAWLPGLTMHSGGLQATPAKWTSLVQLLVFTNALGMFGLHFLGAGARRLRWALVLSWGVADLLFPALLWAALRRGQRRPFEALRLIPALLIFGMPFVPIVLHVPSGFENTSQFNPALRPVLDGSCQQALIDPANGRLIVTDDDQHFVMMIDPDSDKVLRRELFPELKVQWSALDQERDGLIIADPFQGQTVFMDRQSLRIEHAVSIQNPLVLENNPNPWRTLYDPATGLIYAYGQGMIVLISSDGSRILATINGVFSDIVLDQNNRVLHAGPWTPGPLLALDPTTLEIRREAPISVYTMRLVLDQIRGRLIITEPVNGRLLVLDAHSYRRIMEVDAFPGVRTMALDYASDRLYLGGLSPLLEIRSLDDYSLIDRVYALPYMRWIEVDRSRNRLYIASKYSGLWAVDLDLLGDGSISNRLRRLDPFYPLLNIANRLAQRLMQWKQQIST